MMKSPPLTCLVAVLVVVVVILQLQVPQAQAAVPVTYSCSGSILCGTLSQGSCNAARDSIQPNNRYFTGGGKRDSGPCSGHCGLFVSGTNCDLNGNEMIDAFNELRSRGCFKCGKKTFDDGCQFKMDYVGSGC